MRIHTFNELLEPFYSLWRIQVIFSEIYTKIRKRNPKPKEKETKINFLNYFSTFKLLIPL